MLLGVFLGACGGKAKTAGDLVRDVTSYQDGIRWGNLPQAAARIPAAERNAFLDEREPLVDELKIDEVEISRVQILDEEQKRAEVQVQWTWHMDDEGIVRRTTSAQRWRRYGKKWMLIEEARVRGEEMPGLAELFASEDPAKQGEEGDEKNGQGTDSPAPKAEKEERLDGSSPSDAEVELSPQNPGK